MHVAASTVSDVGTIAALTGVAPVKTASPGSTPFVALIHLLTRPEQNASGPSALRASQTEGASGDESGSGATGDSSTGNSPYAAASSGTIADAIIRAMLGGRGESASSLRYATPDSTGLISTPVAAPSVAPAALPNAAPASSQNGTAPVADGSLAASFGSGDVAADAVATIDVAATVKDAMATDSAATDGSLAIGGTGRKRKSADAAAAPGLVAGVKSMIAAATLFANSPLPPLGSGTNAAASSNTNSIKPALAASSDAAPTDSAPGSPNPLLATQPGGASGSLPGRGGSGPLAFGANLTPKSGGEADGANRVAQTSPGSSSTSDDSPGADPGSSNASKTFSFQELAGDSANPPQAGFGNFAAVVGAPAVAGANPGERGASNLPDASPARAPADVTTDAPAASPAQPQEMLLHVAPLPSPNNSSPAGVDIRVTQRAGDVLVTVHTPDPALQANLREDLPELVSSLDRAGFDAQTFVPRTGAVAGASFEPSAGGNASDSSNSGGAADSRSGNTGDSGQFSRQSQSFSGQASDQQHQPRDRQAQRWLDQIEE